MGVMSTSPSTSVIELHDASSSQNVHAELRYTHESQYLGYITLPTPEHRLHYSSSSLHVHDAGSYVRPRYASAGAVSRCEPLDAELIEVIEHAQIQGELAVSEHESLWVQGMDTAGQINTRVLMTISKHGLVSVNVDTMEVVHRYPLHSIAQVIGYDDIENRHNVAVRTKSQAQVHCHLFQCDTQDAADSICRSLQSIFDQEMKNA